MRILLLTSMVPQAHGRGAIPVLLDAQLEALRERHDVTLVTAIGDEPGESLAADALLAGGHSARFADRRRPPAGRRRWRRRVELTSSWTCTRLPWRTVWFAVPGVQRVLDELGARQAFDLVAVEDSAMAMFRLPLGVPTVLTEYEVRRRRRVDWRAGRRPARWPRWAIGELDWRRWAEFQRRAWRRFDRIQVFTPRDARAITDLVPELGPRIRVNPFGLVIPPLADPRAEHASTVVFVGNFSHAPNRDGAFWLAREIMPALAARHPGVRLRIVGSFPTREILALARPGVEVLADLERVEPQIESATLVAAPLRIGGGMRMKVLHALASGKPVVTTARGAEGLDGHGGALPLVLAETTEEFAARAAELLDDERRRRELGRAARAFAVAHHSPQAWARRLESVYDEARSARGGGAGG